MEDKRHGDQARHAPHEAHHPHPHGSPTAFAEKGSTESVVLNGIQGKVPRRPLAPAIAKALSDASSDNWTLYGGALDVPPSELAAQMADSALFNAFAYSVLFRAGGGSSMTWGGGDSGGPDMRVEASSPKALYDILLTALSEQYEPPRAKPGAPAPDPAEQAKADAHREARKQALAKDLKAALDAEFEGADLQAFHAHWDNADDTTIEGALAVHPSTGEVRALVAWQPA